MCICDDCIKKDVCRLQEHCTKLEEHYKGLTVDEAFTVTVLCKYKQVAKPMVREPLVHPKTWTKVAESGDFRDEARYETQNEWLGKDK